MASRHDIITLPNAHLRQKSAPVHKISDETHQLIHDMQAATLDWEASRPHEVGVALAAVQIDQLHSVVVVREDFEDKDNRNFFTLINPKITKSYGDIVYDYEGCLSIKDVYGYVPRYNKVKITAIDEHGKEVRMSAEGFLARILQHEIDHTHGTLFIDHIKGRDAFFHLDTNGELTKLNYDTAISKSNILW